MIDHEQRQRIILHQEGAILANVGNCGTDIASEVARCQIDGIANALIRMQGAEDTAHFIFALSDRVAGGLRDGTQYFPTLVIDGPIKLADDEPDDPPPPVAQPQNRVPDFAYGFLCGLVAMLVVTWLAMGRL